MSDMKMRRVEHVRAGNLQRRGVLRHQRRERKEGMARSSNTGRFPRPCCAVLRLGGALSLLLSPVVQLSGGWTQGFAFCLFGSRPGPVSHCS